MRLSHTLPVVAARFDDPNLESVAGVVPVMRLATDAGLGALAGQLLTVLTENLGPDVRPVPRFLL